MIWLKRLLPKNSFSRSVSILVGGTVGSQAIVVLASPILTRLYTPEDFGLLAVYSSILSLFTIIASLRYELAIPLPDQDSEAIHIVILSLLILVFTTIMSALIILIVGNTLSILINSPKMASYLWLIPFGVFFIGSYKIFNYWAIRSKNFGHISKTKFYQSIVALSIKLFGYKLSTLSLILGQNIGQAMGVFSLAKPVLKHPSFKSWQWSDIRQTAIFYKHFPMFSTWSGLLNTASIQLPPLLFAVFFSSSAAGLYALAHRILALPMSLIGGAVADVFFSNAAKAYRENKLATLFETVYAKLVSIILPVVLVLAIDAPNLFAFIFGENWREAGTLARWMTLWVGTVFVASPLNTIFTVLEKQKESMHFQTIMLSARILAIWLGFYNDSMILAVQLFSIFSMLCWTGFLIWTSKQIGSNIYKLLEPLLQALPFSIVCTLPLLINSYIDLPQAYWYFSIFLTAILTSIYYIKTFKKVIL